MTTKYLSRLAVLAALPVLLAACGDDAEPDAVEAPGETSAQTPDETATETEAAVFPVTVGNGENAVEIAAEPARIVSLSATATEMLFAIDAGDQITAADSYSNYPAEAPTTELSAFEPNVEAIVGYEPDLVIAASDPGELVAGLTAVDVPTLILPAAATLDDSYTQIEQLGAATGKVGEAAELVAQMQSDIEELTAEVPDDAPEATYFHELDANLYTVTSNTFLGELYALAGLSNIADEAPEAGGDYPQLSPEFIVTADPDIVFFADGGAGGVTADAIAARPGWDQLTAVQQDRIVEVDPDIASRWGPRIVDYLQVVIDARTALEPVQ